MRILFYSPHPTHDIVSDVGYAIHQRQTIAAFSALGHEVLPVILGGTAAGNLTLKSNQNYQASKLKTLIKQCLPKWLWTSLNNLVLRQHDAKAKAILEKAIATFKPDLLYERSEYLQDSGALMAKKFGLQYYLEVNAPLVQEMYGFEGYSLYHKKAHKIERFKLFAAHKIIAVSSALSHYLSEQYNITANKFLVQPNCINPEQAQNADAQKAHKINAFNKSSRKVIGFVGSMLPYHGVDKLIAAYKHVQAKHSNTLLCIMGDGVVLQDLKQMVKDLNLTDSVLFTGQIPHSEIMHYIAATDICIMAESNWYGSPVKIFEYGLMGKPIIAPATMPVQDVMQDQTDGLLVSNQPEMIANAINTMLEQPDFAKQMAQHFHEKVMTNYTWQQAALNTLNT